MHRLRRLELTRPVDGASLALVRVLYGAIGAFSMVRILANGWVESLYAGPRRHFTYPLLGWVRAPTAAGMYVLVAVVLAASLAVMIGWQFRIALAVFWIGFAWIEFIDVTTYLNHYWFMSLFGLLLFVAPVQSGAVAVGWVWLFRAQIAVVYVFAGLAKLNEDWLLHALPLRLWLPTRTDVPLLGALLDERWVAFAFSWLGAAFDCTIVGFLLWRRTRFAAWLVVVAFHVLTWRLFAIGVFPWLMIGATTVFFDPSWPRRFGRRPAQVPVAAARRKFPIAAAAIWIAIQLLVPLRHLAIPGEHRWTGEGYRWSWNVLLTERGGDVSFRITDHESGTTWFDDASSLYTPIQWKVMSTDAELIRQAAHALKREYGELGHAVEVRADAFVSLNGRQAARLIDPTVNLADQPWRLHQPWILAP